MTTPIRLEGYALHSGVVTAVTLARQPGSLTWKRGPLRAELSAMRATRTDFGVRIEGGPGLAIDLVEHLLAALGGLGIH